MGAGVFHSTPLIDSRVNEGANRRGRRPKRFMSAPHLATPPTPALRPDVEGRAGVDALRPDVEGRILDHYGSEFVRRRVAALATNQLGVVERGQLKALGIGDGDIARWAATGRLHRVHAGVYAVGHRSLTPKARCSAAVLACGAGAVVSHASAAALLGLRTTRAAVVDVSVPDRSGRRQPGLRIHRPSVFDAVDSSLVEGIPCTTVARTLVDLAGVVPPPALERAVEAAYRTGVLDIAGIVGVLERVSRPRGVRALRRIVGDELLGTVMTRSRMERMFRALCLDAGLPMPISNTHVEVLPGT